MVRLVEELVNNWRYWCLTLLFNRTTLRKESNLDLTRCKWGNEVIMRQIVHPTKQPSNIFHLTMDIAWFGLATATTTRFLSVYAIHLGATSTHLTWLAALPALVLLIGSTLSGWWRKHFSTSQRALMIPAFFHRFSFFMLALTPFMPIEWQPYWLIVSMTLPAIPQGIASVLFFVFMRESVDTEQWVILTSRRSLAMNATIAIGALVAGLWLENVAFPLNYQVMFLIAFVATMASMWHITRVHPKITTPAVSVSIFDRQLWQSQGLRLMTIMVLLTHGAFFMIVPLVPLYLIENLGATETFIAFFSTAELIGAMVISMQATKYVQRWGNKRIVVIGMIGTGIAGLMIALTPVLWLTVPAAALLGASWAIVAIGILGVMAESTPTDQATPSTMIFMQSIGLAMFLGPMLGNLIINLGFDLVTVLLFGAGLRIIAGLMIANLRTEKRTQPELSDTYA